MNFLSRFATLFVVSVAGLPIVGRALNAQPPVGSEQPPMAKVTRIGSHPWESLGYIVLSPGGRFAIVESDRILNSVDRTTGKVVRIASNSQSSRWSPDGRFIAFQRHDDGTPYVWIMPMNPATGLPASPGRRVSVQPGRNPAWSPDGRQLAYITSDTSGVRIMVVPFNGGTETVVMQLRGGASGLSWTPDGRFIFTRSFQPRAPRYHIMRLELASGRIDSILDGGATGPPARPWLALSSDGRTIAQFTDLQNTQMLLLSNPTNGAELGTVLIPPSVRISSWSPTAPDRLIGWEEIIESNIHAVDLSTGSVREITKGKRIDQHPSFSPDGTRIAFTTRVGDRIRVAVANADGSNERIIQGAADAQRPLVWSPDGRYIAYTITVPVHAIQVVDVAAGIDRRLTGVNPDIKSNPVIDIAWRGDSKAVRHVGGPDGQRVLYHHYVSGGNSLADSTALPDSIIGRPIYVNDSLMIFAGSFRIRAFNIATKQVVRTISVPGNQGLGSIVANAEWIAFTHNTNPPVFSKVLYIASLRTGELRQIPHPLGPQLISLAMDPAGRYIILRGWVAGEQNGPHLVQIPLNGDPPRVLTKYPGFVGSGTNFYSLSPDGRTLIYDVETVRSAALVEIILPPIRPRQ